MTEQYLAAYKGAEGVHIRRSSTPSAGPITPRTGRRSPRQKRAAYATRKLSTIEDEDAKIKAIKDTMTKQVQALPESARESLRAYTGFGSPCEFCDSAWKHPATGTRGNYCCWTTLWRHDAAERYALGIRHYLFSISAFPQSLLNKNCRPSFAQGIFLSSLLQVLGICNFPAVIQFFKCTFLKDTRVASLFSPWHCQSSGNQDEVLFSEGCNTGC